VASRVSVQGAATAAKKADEKARKAATAAQERGSNFAADSFVNFQQKLGIGTDSPLTTGGFGFNPITRQRVTLEWAHRGSWIAGLAIDVIAEDMTKMGVEIQSDLDPDQIKEIDKSAVQLRIWPNLKNAIQWGRLYGGAIAVMLVNGQQMNTEFRLETIGKGQFKGIYVLDRWQIEPSLNDLVTEFGPNLGLPKYYTVVSDAPALRGQKIHYTRVIRFLGNELPYQQRLQEQLWGESVLERLWDRLIGFESASTGAAQLVYKAWIRTYAIDGLRDIIGQGGKPLEGLMQMVLMMRRFMGNEGITLIDAKDKMETMQNSAFSGLSDVLLSQGQQLSGGMQVPLVRLFGQSPAGLNASGESDLRTYYDNIKAQQNKDLNVGCTILYTAISLSLGIEVPEVFGINFRSLWQLTDKEKSEIAETTTRAVGDAEDHGFITQQAGMKELKQSSHTTGIFTNITAEDIEAASDELLPSGEEAIRLQAEAAGAGKPGANKEPKGTAK
jgi:uncharacterized protein